MLLRAASRCNIVARASRCSTRCFGQDTRNNLSWNTDGVTYRGYPYPPDCSLKSIQDAEAWQCGENDVYVCTYPKSGTTWMLHTIYQLINWDNPDFDKLHRVLPFWESNPEEGLHISLSEAEEPRVIKTHVPLSLLPNYRNGRGKFVYVVRDPRSVVESFYHHSMLTSGSKQLSFNNQFDTFFQKFMTGQIYYGSWFDHVADAVQQRERPLAPLLFVYYEDMKQNLAYEVGRLLNFLQLDKRPTNVANVLERCGFEWMKDNQSKLDFTQEYPGRDTSKSFFRKGKTGEWAELGPSHHRALARKMEEFELTNQLPYQMIRPAPAERGSFPEYHLNGFTLEVPGPH
eukprot:NODE_792_length_1193_cov_86.448405_g751_i0.p1 GENE.NODE_792_length_1193_cov_86.448405_g751_i0~~NODE_792_length_1193_cov_86.448405_g751_i0.p1  ORF type:complete len:344 (-),score=21.21 NODE_792_length_1193_cov_86.448405_g751_i0:98-1129(-)